MSDDLVKRLRDLGDRAEYMPHMHHIAADRIAELEAELREAQDRSNAFATKEYHTEVRAEAAEAKLAKAVEALIRIDDLTCHNMPMTAREEQGVNREARAALAELKGEKDGDG